MLDNRVWKMVESYFSNRSEFIESPKYEDIQRAVSATLRFCTQDPTREFPEHFPMSVDTMVGYKEDSQKALDLAKHAAEDAAAGLYGFDKAQIRTQQLSLMRSGGTLPVRADVTILGETDELKKSLYLKNFGLDRLLGLELYSLIGGINTEYTFAFNRDIIVEDEIEGKVRSGNEVITDTLAINLIKHDALSIFMGYDDFMKPANGIITEDQRVIVIDFDCAGNSVDENMRKQWAQSFAVGEERYNTIFEAQMNLLKDRVLKSQHKIQDIAKIMQESGEAELVQSGMGLKKNLDKIIRGENI